MSRAHDMVHDAVAPVSWSAADRASIRDQVERVLASPLFRNSRRYTSLLRFSVERRLAGDLQCLKERTIGVEVFGRDADYNTTQDPVVRTSAVEIRKRLAEYYQQPGHESEIRIELPAGCYIPEFQIPAPVPELPRLLAPAVAVTESTEPVQRTWPVILSVAVGVVAMTAMILWRPWVQSNPLDQFWRPVWESSSPVLFFVTGTPARPQPSAAAATDPLPTLSDIFRSGRNSVPLPDVIALVNIASYLKGMGKNNRIQLSSEIQFPDLKTGPAVLIGPVGPKWRDLLCGGWRFTVERDATATLTWIQDRNLPESRAWSVEVNAPANSTADAYALVTRVWNETIGQPVVSVAGLSTYGTTAAGEFLTDSKELQQLANQAPRGWSRRNIQVVIATKRIGTNSGKPRVAAAHFW